MFDRLFCNHEYIYIDRKFIYHFPGSDEYRFTFICKNCRKVKYVSSLDIEKISDVFIHDLNRMIVLDKFVDYSKTYLVIPIRCGYSHSLLSLRGYVADKTIDYFKKKYSIDITQIDDSND